jgi:hypothetical protein
MAAESELHHAFSEWGRLAEAEGQAIRAGNWSFVADCQHALTHLRPIINRLTVQAGPKPTGQDSSSTSSRTSLRVMAMELIELERRNLAWLEHRRQTLSAHVEHLSRTGRNLRGIQRSYAPPTPSGWSSYS